MRSPFIFGSTVSKVAFTNRKVEVKRLESNMLNGINTIIISPRRWGKTSLVEHVVNRIILKGQDIAFIQMDLFAIQIESDFLSEFARLCIRAVTSKWEEWSSLVKDVFINLIPRIVINMEGGGDFTLEFDQKEIKKYREEILNLPETLAKSKKKNVIVCIDEFQNIRNYILT